MKAADMSPIHKKLDMLLKDNYRPVSVLCILAKLFENVLALQLSCYFEGIFDQYICAYRKSYSCENVLIYHTEIWRKALDDKKVVGAVLMDLSMAFDCLPHRLLIAKLGAYNVSSNASKLVASYLANRRQRVKVANCKSNWGTTSKGIPQGSGLGPLVFNIFMNDLFHFIKECTLINYADDNTITAYHQDIAQLMEILKEDSCNAIKWFESNFMKANPSKFQVMFLKPPCSRNIHIPDNFHILQNELKISKEVKLLGVHIDAKLSFNAHISRICKKAANQLNALKRIHANLGQEEKILIFNSFILSKFNFCPLVWHFCGKSNTAKMEKLQYRALKYIFNDSVTDYEQLVKKANTTTLFLSRIKKLLLRHIR